jgi:hypothetical protein
MSKQYGTPGPRLLYPSVSTSQSLAACHPMAQLLFDRLMAQADDQGRLIGDPKVVRALCMPLIPMATPRKVATWLAQLAHEGMVKRYESGGRALLQLVNWWTSQGSMKRSYPSRWAPPPGWKDRIRGVDPLANLGDKVPPDPPESGEEVPPHADATEPNPTEPDQTDPFPTIGVRTSRPSDFEVAGAPDENARPTSRDQVLLLWATRHGWPAGPWPADRQDDRVQLSSRWHRYSLAFWKSAIDAVPIGATIRWLITPPAPGVVCRLEEWHVDWVRKQMASVPAPPGPSRVGEVLARMAQP